MKSFLCFFPKKAMNIVSMVNKSLKYKLIIFFIMLSVVPILVLGSISYVVTSKNMIKKEIANSTATVMNKINNFDLVFNEIEEIIVDITTSIDIQDFLKYTTKDNIEEDKNYEKLIQVGTKFDYIINFKRDLIDSIMLLPSKDKYPIFRGNYNIRYTDDFSKSDIFIKTVDSEKNLFWLSSLDSDMAKVQISVSKTIYDMFTGDVIGILVIYLNVKELTNYFNSITTETDEYMFIVDKKNIVLFQSNLKEIDENLLEKDILFHIENERKDSFVKKINKTQYIITTRMFEMNEWRIVNVIPYHNTVRDAYKLSQLTLIASIICTIYAILVAVIVFMNIYTPLNKLMSGMKELGKGKFDINISVNQQDEIGQLANNFNDMAKRMKNLVEKIKQEQKLKKENEIKALQAQIMPHFLYNTLNTIKVLARSKRYDDIIKMVVAFIRLLRISISNNNDFITIIEELGYVKSYIEIMKYRYDKKITLNVEVNETIKECAVLKFMIQPIVENCIIHAFNQKEGECIINVIVNQYEEDIRISIIDNGIGMDKKEIDALLLKQETDSRIRFSKIGIDNINERIKLHFGHKYGLNFTSIVGIGTEIIINLPRLYLDNIG